MQRTDCLASCFMAKAKTRSTDLIKTIAACATMGTDMPQILKHFVKSGKMRDSGVSHCCAGLRKLCFADLKKRGPDF